MRHKNNKLAAKEGRSEALEKILNQEVTLDMDILDFFIIGGWGRRSWGGGIYKAADLSLKKEINEYLEFEYGKLSSEEKHIRARFVHSALNARARNLLTISDFKRHIETNGLNIRRMGYVGLAHFNKTIEKFGLDSIKVGGKNVYTKTLNKYGLEKAK